MPISFSKTLLMLGSTAALMLFGYIASSRAQQSKTWKPYVLHQTESSTSLRTNTTTSRTRMRARFSDGSVVTADTTPAEHPMHSDVRQVVSTSEGKRVEVDDQLKAKTTYFIKDFRHAPVGETCSLTTQVPAVSPVVIGHDEIFGMATVVIEVHNGPFTTRTWEAPELDCVVLKTSEDRFNDTGQLDGHFEMVTNQVQLGEPDRLLLSIDPSYRELSPLQMTEAKLSIRGLSMPDKIRQTKLFQEQVYSKNHREAGMP